MNGNGAMDYDLARAIQLSVEMEEAFGIDQLPKGESIPLADLGGNPGDAAESLSRPTIQVTGPKQEAEPFPALTPPSLEQISEQIRGCEACDLCHGRSKVVPGQGNPKAALMFIGEAPGAEEDASGEAFVGPAGQLLTKMIQAMGLSRDEVFIANILKCRPPGNRNPRPEETASCFHFLADQIDLVSPKVICTLGAQATNRLLDCTELIGRLRGRSFPYRGAQLVPTYHPAYLLREASAKRAAWQDLQKVMGMLAKG